MNSCVATDAKPLHFEWLRVVAMVAMKRAYRMARFAGLRPDECTRLDGRVHCCSSGDLMLVSLLFLSSACTYLVWIGSLPIPDSSPVFFAVVQPPFIAALLGSLWITGLPRFGYSDRAWLASGRSSELVAFAEVEVVQRLILFTGRAPLRLHDLILFEPGNHYSIAHEGRA